MATGIHVLLLSLVALGGSLASASRGRYMNNKQALQKMFRCAPCDYQLCPPLEEEGCEPVLEPGICGCCFVCARTLGDTCGIKKGRCGEGLTCRPRPDDPTPMASLLMGRAICTPANSQFYRELQ